MTIVKSSTPRVATMRLARETLGQRRLELYAHTEDWPAIKALAERLQKRRARLAKQQAG